MSEAVMMTRERAIELAVKEGYSEEVLKRATSQEVEGGGIIFYHPATGQEWVQVTHNEEVLAV